DNGLHTSLVARWPKKITSGRTNAIVQYADILPTILDLAGSKSNPKTFDGRSFAGVLLGEDAHHRDYAFGMHNNYPEGPTYPIRSITNGKWRYIRNLSHASLYIEKHLMGKHEQISRILPYTGRTIVSEPFRLTLTEFITTISVLYSIKWGLPFVLDTTAANR
ncbi:hypothetical protein N9184_01855, partial [bacterium]|nr:hypothetical protein [bacterium]